MKRTLITATMICASLGADAFAGAVTITFDEFTNSGHGEITGNEYLTQGIQFWTPDWILNLGGTTGSSPNSLGADKNTLNDFDGGVNFQFTNNRSANDVTFTIFNTPFQAKAYDVNNVLLKTINSGGDFTQYFDFSGHAVNRVEVTGSFYAIDDVSFTLDAVPEPASIAMWGLGAVGACLYTRRRKTRRA